MNHSVYEHGQIEISEEVYQEARNKAWERLDSSSRTSTARRWLWAPVLAGLLAVFGLWLASRQSSERAVLSDLAGTIEALPGPKTLSENSFRLEPMPWNPRPADRKQSTSRNVNPVVTSPDSSPPDRVIISFRLPETGVRMIWIKEKTFDVSGGTQ